MLQLYFPVNLVSMFSFLSIANTDISVVESAFKSAFNLNENTFPNDTPVSEKFKDMGYSSRKIIMNVPS